MNMMKPKQTPSAHSKIVHYEELRLLVVVNSTFMNFDTLKDNLY